MGGFIKALRDGEWLTAERARLWAIALLLASLAAVLYILATAEGLNDYQGRPIGTDFSNVYAAGSYVLEGRPQAPFDSLTQHARKREIFGAATPFYGWHYPPFFLSVAAAGIAALSARARPLARARRWRSICCPSAPSSVVKTALCRSFPPSLIPRSSSTSDTVTTDSSPRR